MRDLSGGKEEDARWWAELFAQTGTEFHDCENVYSAADINPLSEPSRMALPAGSEKRDFAAGPEGNSETDGYP